MKDLNKKVKEKFENFFDWIKGAELIELRSCNPEEDPIRPELNNDFRTSYGRKIYGVKYKNEICAIMCFGFTNEIISFTITGKCDNSLSIIFLVFLKKKVYVINHH